jgi:glutathione S-transferase
MGYVLRSAGPSPFARKIRIAASLLGIADQMTYEGADSMNEGDSIRQQNPLGKIPVLITEDGVAIYDSRVILEFLDLEAGGGKIIPTEKTARIEAQTLQALGDGMMDAGILIVYEGRYRPDQEPYGPWLDYQRGKIERGIDALAANPPALDQINVGHIAIACALGHYDFRNQVDWRARQPKLVDWLDAFAAKVPAFAETRPDL